MIDFILLVSRQGKVRLSKWFSVKDSKQKARITREASALILNRPAKMCNFVEYKEQKLVYKRYATLFFVMCIGKEDNELIALEMLHTFVEVMDKYFSNVCELDVIFNFHKVYYILDELFLSGELQESNKKEVQRIINYHDTACNAERR